MRADQDGQGSPRRPLSPPAELEGSPAERYFPPGRNGLPKAHDLPPADLMFGVVLTVGTPRGTRTIHASSQGWHVWEPKLSYGARRRADSQEARKAAQREYEDKLRAAGGHLAMLRARNEQRKAQRTAQSSETQATQPDADGA